MDYNQTVHLPLQFCFSLLQIQFADMQSFSPDRQHPHIRVHHNLILIKGQDITDSAYRSVFPSGNPDPVRTGQLFFFHTFPLIHSYFICMPDVKTQNRKNSQMMRIIDQLRVLIYRYLYRSCASSFFTVSCTFSTSTFTLLVPN